MTAVRSVRLLALAAPLAAAVLTGSALAYVCHPAAPGTRTLSLAGTVRAASLLGGRAELVVAARGGCRRVSWSTATGAVRTRASSCAVRTPAAQSAGVAALGVDTRGRPVLRLAGRTLPLPADAKAVTVDHGLALVQTTRPDRGVFAVRLRDGAFTMLGPDGGGFAARLDTRGALYHDGESKRALRDRTTVVRFVPRQAILAGLARTTTPLTTGGAINAISMDGLRVALAVRDRTGVCDRVLYWNVAWPPVQRISAPAGPTCDAGARGTRIDALAIGGFRTEWVAAQGGAVRLIAGSPKCQEWVVLRLGRGGLRALAADGSTVAYATRAGVGVVTGSWRPRPIATGSGAPRAVTVDGSRVAILGSDGNVEIRTTGGALVARPHVGAAHAIALEAMRLVALRPGRLDVFDTRSGARIRSIVVAAGAHGLDVQDGVAALARGRYAVVVDLRSGRTAVVGAGPRPLVGVQIERPGLAYAWSTGRSGVARFVPAGRIDAALGLAP